ncbi:MAG TPA: M23 family metallopeptidase [Methylophilaceae bacterium]|jgi:murein DD-endopeptidase MepM/ murein hydrolase activator NlpD
MNIIFVSNNMAKAKTLSLRQGVLLLVLLIVLPVMLTLALILPQGDDQHHGVQNLLPSPLHFSLHNTQEHLDALALQLGEIQARVMRLDALSDRLAKLAGVKEKDLEQGMEKDQAPGRGGPEVAAYSLNEEQLKQKIAELATELERRSDRLSVLEAVLLQQSLQKDTLPSSAPVQVGYNSSSYGWRVDPFTGKMAFHEGLDFMAEIGTPIYAAAGGIVTSAEQTPDYGKIIKIDHGSGLETRYAHTSQMLVKAGDRVEKGQLIGRVGSTGRSTGAHLHFEVRLNGAALDPRKYLQSRAG